MVKIKQKAININVQAAKIKKYFLDSKINVKKDKLVWKYHLSPTPISDIYPIKLSYKLEYHPNVYVIDKKLKLYPGKNHLPHTYDTEKQWLCLYYRKANEWNSQMFIADTIIPWISEWLYYYEFWLTTGEWFGKGIHGKPIPIQKENNEKNRK